MTTYDRFLEDLHDLFPDIEVRHYGKWASTHYWFTGFIWGKFIYVNPTIGILRKMSTILHEVCHILDKEYRGVWHKVKHKVRYVFSRDYRLEIEARACAIQAIFTKCVYNHPIAYASLIEAHKLRKWQYMLFRSPRVYEAAVAHWTSFFLTEPEGPYMDLVLLAGGMTPSLSSR